SIGWAACITRGRDRLLVSATRTISFWAFSSCSNTTSVFCKWTLTFTTGTAWKRHSTRRIEL
ncbi:hypothetical protein PFISCL1PPCAC_13030, partial [Pristionchus fissidentatus]